MSHIRFSHHLQEVLRSVIRVFGFSVWVYVEKRQKPADNQVTMLRYHMLGHRFIKITITIMAYYKYVTLTIILDGNMGQTAIRDKPACTRDKSERFGYIYDLCVPDT